MAVRKKNTGETVPERERRDTEAYFGKMFGITLVSLALVLIVARIGEMKAGSDRDRILLNRIEARSDSAKNSSAADAAPTAIASRIERLRAAGDMLGIAAIIIESCLAIAAFGLIVRDEKTKWFLLVVPVLAGVCAVVVTVLAFVSYGAA